MAGRRTSTRSILDIFLGPFYITLISSSSSVQSRRLPFASNNPTYDVLEGDTIQLVCEQPTSLINIERVEEKKQVIFASNWTIYTPDIFSFIHIASTGILTISNITRKFGKEYICTKNDPDLNEQSLTLNVIYKLSDITPACTSNYSFDNIGYNTNDVFHFTCTAEEANPRVKMSMFIYDKNGTKRNVRKYADTSNITLSHQFNQSLVSNQSGFVCEVSQEFPPPYEDHTYTRHCSLQGSAPNFSVTVEPFNPTVDHDQNITLTCASNVSGITLKWTWVPDNCLETNETRATNLMMTCNGSFENATFDVNCTGSYRGITTFNSTSIYARTSRSETEDFEMKWFSTMTLLIAGMILICVVFGVGVLAFLSKRQRHSMKNNHTTTETYNVSENNSNNSPHHTEGTNQNTPRMDEGYDSSQTGTEDNPIYEPYTEKSPTYPGYHGNTTGETSAMIDITISKEVPMAAMSVNTAEGCHYESI